MNQRRGKVEKPGTSGQITPKEIANELLIQCPDIIKVPEREREILALHAIYIPPARIAKMLGLKLEDVMSAVRDYGTVVSMVGDALRMKIMRMSVWRFAATQVSILMDADTSTPKEAIANLEKIPRIMEQLADAEKSLIAVEKEHKEMNWDDFGKSLG
jgi:hypothetical protein